MQEQRYVYFQEIATKRQFHTATELAQDLTDIYQITKCAVKPCALAMGSTSS